MKILKIDRNINWINLTVLYFKKMILSFWFYLLILFTPLIFTFAFYTSFPSYLVIDSVFAFTIVFNVLFFYGMLFFSFRRSHFYILVNQKFNNKLYVYLPIFLNLIIVAFATFFITLFITFIFLQFDLMVITGWNSPDHHYQMRNIVDYRWGIFIYYLIIFFLITFVIAFFIQNLSKNFSNFVLISIFLFIIFIMFSGTMEVNVFFNPTPSNNPNDILYSYDSEKQIITFKPYFDRNNKIDYKYFNTFTFRNFMQMINPYYWITKWGQFDMLYDTFRYTTITLPGIGLPNDQIIIDMNDPSTWVLLKYQMFSFKSLLWSAYIIIPYFYILFWGIIGIILSKSKKSN